MMRILYGKGLTKTVAGASITMATTEHMTPAMMRWRWHATFIRTALSDSSLEVPRFLNLAFLPVLETSQRK